MKSNEINIKTGSTPMMLSQVGINRLQTRNITRILTNTGHFTSTLMCVSLHSFCWGSLRWKRQMQYGVFTQGDCAAFPPVQLRTTPQKTQAVLVWFAKVLMGFINASPSRKKEAAHHLFQNTCNCIHPCLHMKTWVNTFTLILEMMCCFLFSKWWFIWRCCVYTFKACTHTWYFRRCFSLNVVSDCVLAHLI